MVQVYPAHLPYKLIHIKDAPEFPRFNGFVHQLSELFALPCFHRDQSLANGIGLQTVIELEHAGGNRATSMQTRFLRPAQPALEDCT